MRETLNAVPLLNDPTTRYLSWTVIFMVWLTTLILGFSIIISNLGNRSVNELMDKFTIQINPTELDRLDTFEAKIGQSIEILMKLPGTESVKKLSHSQMKSFLRPLLESEVLPELPAFPLPTLLEIKVTNKGQFSRSNFKSLIMSAIPHAKVIERSTWLDSNNRIRNAINLLTLGIIGLIFAASIVSIIFTTRAGLIIHSDIIELLYLLGARNKDIARQFSNHSFSVSLKGTLFGWLFAAITFFVFAQILNLEIPYVSAVLSITWPQWASLALTGVIAVMLSTIVSNITVREKLRRLL